MALPPQADRSHLPLERTEELHRPLQRQLPRRRRQAQEGDRQLRLPRLHERVHR